MRIKTITCHDVYNAGASLQAYALSAYLRLQGHEVEIIDYKPEYLSRQYRFTAVDNPRFNSPLLCKWLYLILKFPGRLKKYSHKKKFDCFRKEYMKLTKRYTNMEELKQDPPEADLYIAGSDQIWNSLFPNGRDGVFYLDFAPKERRKASYAASFATEEIASEWQKQVGMWLHGLDRISVREKSALKILDRLGLQGCNVLDPVFLLPAEHWKGLIGRKKQPKGIFVYDFDHNPLLKELSLFWKERTGEGITGFFAEKYVDKKLKAPGPIEFLEVIYGSEIILSNSFHATAFALLFHREFYVVRRKEDINVRMTDLLTLVGLEDRMVADRKDMAAAGPIDWDRVDGILQKERVRSMVFLTELTDGEC